VVHHILDRARGPLRGPITVGNSLLQLSPRTSEAALGVGGVALRPPALGVGGLHGGTVGAVRDGHVGAAVRVVYIRLRLLGGRQRRQRPGLRIVKDGLVLGERLPARPE
jgi:hypothetical protein